MNDQSSGPISFMINRNTLPWFVFLLLVVVFLLLVAFAPWRGSTVGPQVQVPMFYDAHYLFPRPWTQEQSAPGVPDPAPIALYGENIVSQSFIAGADNLSGISLSLAGPEGSRVDATLSDDSGRRWMADIFVAPDNASDEVAIAIPAQPDSKGRQYTFTVQAPGATYDQPVVVESVGGDRLGDALRINEYYRPGNLALTTYSKGTPGLWWLDAVGEQLLPRLFRIRLQQYKPEPFKGSLFVWLLVLTIGLSAALIVLANPGRSTHDRSVIGSLARTLGWFLVFLLGSFIVWQLGSGRVQPFAPAKSIQAESATPVERDTAVARPVVVSDLISDLWTAERAPEARLIITDIVGSHPAIRVPGDSRINYAITLPPDSRLRFATAVEGQGPISFGVSVNEDKLFETVEAESLSLSLDQPFWHELDLAPYAGQGVVLSLITASDSADISGLWLMPQLVTDASWLLDEMPHSEDIRAVGVRFNESVELLGITLDEGLQDDADIFVQLLWRSLRPTNQYAKVFVHLLDDEGNLIAQQDGQPVGGAYPFANWRPESLISDEYFLHLPETMRPGLYHLAVGIYDPDSLVRWTAVDSEGTALPYAQVDIDLVNEVSE